MEIFFPLRGLLLRNENLARGCNGDKISVAFGLGDSQEYITALIHPLLVLLMVGIK